MSPLNHKLLRDLWRLKGQAIAIGLVIALGVMTLVMYTGLVTSLVETRQAYYDRYRLAEMFAPVTRAPNHLIRRLAELPGVAGADSRVTGRALINIEGIDLPVQAQAISLPDIGEPRLNDILLTAGRALNSDRADEILLLESFAKAHGLEVGQKLSATMNGSRRSFSIVGFAQSPEFLYTTAPGEFVPDDARFGVIWMSRSSLAATYDMSGAFSEALLSLTRDANEAAVLDAVDRVLEPYGGTGSYGLADQLSNRFVSEEIAGLRAASTAVPPFFLAVAAFLLYVVISRMVQSEEEEIGLMKAFGYTNVEVGTHYFKLVLAIAVGGAIGGCLLGIAAGRGMVELYTHFFKFPFLVFRLDPQSFVIGVATSIFSASVGGLFVMRRVFRLTPAEAMRPPAPADFTRAGKLGAGLAKHLDQPSRMILRRMLRQPGRMVGAIVGIACGMALTAGMLTIYVGFDRTLDLSFSVVDRSDVFVAFTHPAAEKTIFELGQLPGVMVVEPVRYVPVIMRNGLYSYRGAITGLPEGAKLNRALDSNQQMIEMRKDGVVVATALANILHLSPGDRLTMEVREGRQPVIEVPVVAIADTLFGSPAYMDLNALGRTLKENRRVSGAYLKIDGAQKDSIFKAVRDMPAVAGISLKSDARDALVTVMNTGAGVGRFILSGIAFIITFGIVYIAARVAQAERARDLASLRVIGFHTGETGFVLLGELAVVTLIAVPLGIVLGYFLSIGIARGFSTDIYQIPADFSPKANGYAALVVLGAAITSGWLVKRDLDRDDLVATLKTRE